MQNEAVYQRINFLLQAAYQSLKSSLNDMSMCRFYLSTMKVVVRRNVLHMHPDIKRVMCKRCSVLLVPGATARLRTRNKKHKQTVITCLECGEVKRYHSNKTRQQWLDKEGSWQTIMENGKMLNRPDHGKGKKKQKQKQDHKQDNKQDKQVSQKPDNKQDEQQALKQDNKQVSQKPDNKQDELQALKQDNKQDKQQSQTQGNPQTIKQDMSAT